MTDSDEEQPPQAGHEAALFGPADKVDHKTGGVIKFASIDTRRKVLTGKIVYVRAPAPAIQGGKVHPIVYLCYVEGEHIPRTVYPADAKRARTLVLDSSSNS